MEGNDLGDIDHLANIVDYERNVELLTYGVNSKVDNFEELFERSVLERENAALNGNNNKYQSKGTPCYSSSSSSSTGSSSNGSRKKRPSHWPRTKINYQWKFNQLWEVNKKNALEKRIEIQKKNKSNKIFEKKFEVPMGSQMFTFDRQMYKESKNHQKKDNWTLWWSRKST